MSIRPVDLQVIIPRATDVSRVQHAANQQIIAQQQHCAEKIQRLSDRKLKQVQEMLKNEGGKVQREADSKNKHRGAYGNSHDIQTDENLTTDSGKDQSTIKDHLRGQVIDIRT
ncbi:hypothetical protein [Dendrosporobacter sp. 1207_IL3150]|uniref:hypothetical protein n=1 Tax=Dendrosporobacter sp. 1207_IL3150 TaxID=3084054 RepID=UPI002FDA8B7A